MPLIHELISFGEETERVHCASLWEEPHWSDDFCCDSDLIGIKEPLLGEYDKLDSPVTYDIDTEDLPF